MEPVTVGVISIIFLLGLLGLGVSIGLAFILVSFLGISIILGLNHAVSFLGITLYHSIASPSWCSIPVFVLMGAFAVIAGFGNDIYDSVDKLTKRLPGSLGVATCLGSALFGAISGSSLANTAIFGKIALPEMDKYKYDRAFSVAIVASAGTFANMIPPSVNMIIFCLFAEQSIGRLFAAGVVPGLITAAVYIISILWRVKKNPKLAPGDVVITKTLSTREKIGCFQKMVPSALTILIVFSGIYSGLFTPTEAAAAGCFVILLVGWLRKSIIGLKVLAEPLKESANTTAQLFIINVSAIFFSRFFALTDIPSNLAMLVDNLAVPRIVILLLILMVYFFLGMIMVEIGMYALTIPIFLPIIITLGYDPIWFGYTGSLISIISSS